MAKDADESTDIAQAKKSNEATRQTAARNAPKKNPATQLPLIVGIGASAGGLVV